MRYENLFCSLEPNYSLLHVYWLKMKHTRVFGLLGRFPLLGLLTLSGSASNATMRVSHVLIVERWSSLSIYWLILQSRLAEIPNSPSLVEKWLPVKGSGCELNSLRLKFLTWNHLGSWLNKTVYRSPKCLPRIVVFSVLLKPRNEHPHNPQGTCRSSILVFHHVPRGWQAHVTINKNGRSVIPSPQKPQHRFSCR